MTKITFTKKLFDRETGKIGQEWLGTTAWVIRRTHVANEALFRDVQTAAAWNPRVKWEDQVQGTPLDDRINQTIIPTTLEGLKLFERTEWLRKSGARPLRLFSDGSDFMYFREDLVEAFGLERVYAGDEHSAGYAFEHDYNGDRLSDEVQLVVMPWNLAHTPFPLPEPQAEMDFEGADDKDRKNYAKAA
jgi:hypothetical protein